MLTVLEVLVHDPLCDWSVGPSKAAAKQTEKEWEKLQKREDGQGNRFRFFSFFFNSFLIHFLPSTG